MKVKILKYLNEGHERSVRTKWNVVYSVFFRCASILCNFLMIPVLVDYLSPEKFGIWLTVSSIIAWVTFLDIGLGNGLRNKLAEALAMGDPQLAKSYVSTTYAVIAAIVVILLLLFFIINPFLDWSGILNVTDPADDLSLLVKVMFIFFSLRFLSTLITPVLAGKQDMGLNSILDFVVSFLSLLAVFVISRTIDPSLVLLGGVLSFLNFVIPLFVSVWFFTGRYKNISPSWKHIDIKYLRDLTSIGFQFFLIQIAGIIIFSTSNIIIIRILNPEEVTKFNIVFKYFNVIALAFTIVINPFWSAYTEAYVKNDIEWIRSITRRLIQFWGLLAGVVVVMIIVSDYVYFLWIGKDLDIPLSLSVLMGLFVILGTWNNIYVYFINGIAKVRLQLYLAVTVAMFNIPLSIYLVKRIGTEGAVVSSIVCLIPAAILIPVQYKMIIRKRAFGVFNA